jgi:hypothetical protein
MVGEIERNIEQREHAVANQLVDHPAMLDHDVGDDCQMVVEHLQDVAGIGALGQRLRSARSRRSLRA